MLRHLIPIIIVAAASAAIDAPSSSSCTFIQNTDFYMPNQGPSGSATSALDCCTRVCAGQTKFYTFAKSSNQCYCKTSNKNPRSSSDNTAGTCAPDPPPPPPPQKYPNYQGCMDETSKTLPYCNATKSFDERVDDLVSSLNLTEKASRMYSCRENCDTCPCAIPRIGLPPYAYLVEVNTAVAAVCLEKRCATVFSGPLGLAASFNRTVWKQKGEVISTELRAFSNHGGKRGLGKHVGVMGFGPNINVVRDPRFGRNSELPGEDPYLNGEYAKEFTLSMQERDANGYPRMISYLKHFTAYSRETNRGHDTYNISMYDFADTYLPQFAKGMMEGNASGVMCSYNGENGFPSCANGWLLKTMLRERWNRPNAVVVTDSGAVKNLMGAPVNAVSDAAAAAMAINNGSDMNDGPEYQYLPDAVAKGLTSEAQVDEALKRNMKQLFQAGLFDSPSRVTWTNISASVINSAEHQRINLAAAEQAVVLLRNNDRLLPLDRSSHMKIAIVGPQAVAKQGLLSDYATEQACPPISTESDTDYCIISIAEAVAAVAPNRTFVAAGVDVNSNNTDGIAAAISIAKEADVVLLCLGIDKSIEGEGHDRQDITLPGLQSSFAKAILALNKPTILILTNGGALSTEGFDSDGGVNGQGVSAIVEAFNPNVVGSKALASLLFGSVNTWGKLPYTVYPSDYTTAVEMDNFDMTQSPGRTYRYYQGPVNYEFGFGLSYTTFGLTCRTSANVVMPSRGLVVGGQQLATCAVKNIGTMDGDEVVMMFVRPSREVRASADHVLPLKRLVGFDRVRLRKGEEKSINFSYDETTFASTTKLGDSKVYAGVYEVIFWRGNGEEQVFNITVPL